MSTSCSFQPEYGSTIANDVIALMRDTTSPDSTTNIDLLDFYISNTKRYHMNASPSTFDQMSFVYDSAISEINRFNSSHWSGLLDSYNDIHATISSIKQYIQEYSYQLQQEKRIFTYEYCNAKLNEYQKLEKDWDGYGANPPSPESIRDAQNLLTTLQSIGIKTPRLFVSSLEEVGFYWRNETTYIEISFEGSGKYDWFVSKEGKLIFSNEDVSLGTKISSKLVTFIQNEESTWA